MSLAVHGIDVAFLVIAVVVFFIGTIVACIVVQPRAMRWLWASVPLGLLLLTLSFLLKGLGLCPTKSRVTAGDHTVWSTQRPAR